MHSLKEQDAKGDKRSRRELTNWLYTLLPSWVSQYHFYAVIPAGFSAM